MRGRRQRRRGTHSIRQIRSITTSPRASSTSAYRVRDEGPSLVQPLALSQEELRRQHGRQWVWFLSPSNMNPTLLRPTRKTDALLERQTTKCPPLMVGGMFCEPYPMCPAGGTQKIANNV